MRPVRRAITPALCIQAVELASSIPQSDWCSGNRCRTAPMVRARWLAAWLMRRFGRCSFPCIMGSLQYAAHATVREAIGQVCPAIRRQGTTRFLARQSLRALRLLSDAPAANTHRTDGTALERPTRAYTPPQAIQFSGRIEKRHPSVVEVSDAVGRAVRSWRGGLARDVPLIGASVCGVRMHAILFWCGVSPSRWVKAPPTLAEMTPEQREWLDLANVELLGRFRIPHQAPIKCPSSTAIPARKPNSHLQVTSHLKVPTI